MIKTLYKSVKMSFFDKIYNYLIVNDFEEILKGRDPEESLPYSV